MKKLFIIIFLQIFTIHAFAQDLKSIPQRQSVQIGFGLGDYDEIELAKHDPGYYEKDLDYYKSQLTCSKRFFISYSYRIKKWLAIETRFSYKFSRSDYKHIYTLEPYGYDNEHKLYLMFISRFQWVNTNIVAIYSSIGIGPLYTINKDFKNNTKEDGKDMELLPHFTFFGISVGKKIYGTAEIGMKPSGILSFGIGYRF